MINRNFYLYSALLASVPVAFSATALDVTLGPEVNVGAAITTAPFQQYQCDLRTDPMKPDRMVITLKNSNDETQTAAFSTTNGGLNWSVTRALKSGDPDVIFDQYGTAYWTIIDTSASKKPGLLLSYDGGASWSDRKTISPKALDHPHTAADRSPTSPYYNSIYFAGRDFASASLGVVRSRDGGLSWQTSSKSLAGTAGKGFVNQPWVMRDGTLIVPVRSQNNIIIQNGYYAGNRVNTYSVRSTDGGVSFEEPVFVANRDSPKTVGAGGSANFADGGIVGGMWQGIERLYFAFPINPGNNTSPQIQLCTSDDAGKSWTPPRKITPIPPAGKGYTIPSIMVNPDGVVGLQFFEVSGDNFNVFFSASSDGGSTFSTPIRVSSATGKAVPFGKIPRELGGDQIFASAAADGTFRLLWTDNRDRDDLYSIYYRKVTVKPSDPGPGNQAPVSLSLIGYSVTGGSPVGTQVGTLQTSDPDAGDTHIYSLVGGDAAKFRIVGNVLKTATIPNYAATKSHTVIIRSTDNGGLSVQRTIDIAVTPPIANTSYQLLPAADTFVRGGNYSGSKFGNSATLDVKDSQNSSYDRQAFLRFNLSGITKNATSAKLVLTIGALGGESLINRPIDLMLVASDSWMESEMTWSNKPAMGQNILSFLVTRNMVGSEIELDVTSLVNAQRQIDGQISFSLVQPNTAGALVSFGSRESASPGYLEIDTGLPSPPP